ncbi:MAG TPA: aminotransferase class V-fold PLP-dependent enzyme, partial [Gemmatimonadaceae bacterium]|nr:aminotransferase class V-fold PLP-dependent enzyme [Gemmatimonadaceae bacterium]
MSYDVHALRAREFPWAEQGKAVYLNNASTGALPARTLRAVEEFHALRGEPWRLTDEAEMDVLRRARELAARLINAGADEIACLSNTTYGINIAARSLPLKRGDVVLTFDREFPANIYPWMALAKRGVTLERIPARDGLPDEDALLAAIGKPGVRAVAIGWVNFATGYKADLARIGRACRERGIYFVVDAMQGLGGATLDARACCIDILACGGQKWLLAPWGSGFAYVRRELIREIEPEAVGWMAMRASEDFTRLVDYEFAFHEDARR